MRQVLIIASAMGALAHMDELRARLDFPTDDALIDMPDLGDSQDAPRPVAPLEGTEPQAGPESRQVRRARERNRR